jgi:hypothetical protein
VNMAMVAGDSDVEAAMPACILFFPIYNEKTKRGGTQDHPNNIHRPPREFVLVEQSNRR